MRTRRQHAQPAQLTDEERRLLDRLLSDPTLYPMPLKTWLISWLEGSDLSMPLSSINQLTSRLSTINSRLDALETPPAKTEP